MTNRAISSEAAIAEIRNVIDVVVAAFASGTFEHDFWVKDVPLNSCEITCVAVGRRLMDLGYGDGELVNGFASAEGGHFDQVVFHVWLEFKDNNGELFIIDPTAHQFGDLANSPIVARGESPLRSVFNATKWRRKISEPLEWHSDKFHAPILRHVAEIFNAESDATSLVRGDIRPGDATVAG